MVLATTIDGLSRGSECILTLLTCPFFPGRLGDGQWSAFDWFEHVHRLRGERGDAAHRWANLTEHARRPFELLSDCKVKAGAARARSLAVYVEHALEALARKIQRVQRQMEKLQAEASAMDDWQAVLRGLGEMAAASGPGPLEDVSTAGDRAGAPAQADAVRDPSPPAAASPSLPAVGGGGDDDDGPLSPVPPKRRQSRQPPRAAHTKRARASTDVAVVATSSGAKYHANCEVCGAGSFVSVDELTTHLETHMESLECPLAGCHLQFTRHWRLRTHLLRHHHVARRGNWTPIPDLLVPEAARCECFECDARFVDAHSLNEHVRTHLVGTYPQLCPLASVDDASRGCQYTASSQDNLVEHLGLVHYGLLRRCGACGADATGEHVCALSPEMLVGARISVKWKVDDDDEKVSTTEAWFPGRVASFDGARHLVEYEDGMVVYEDLRNRFWQPLDTTVRDRMTL